MSQPPPPPTPRLCCFLTVYRYERLYPHGNPKFRLKHRIMQRYAISKRDARQFNGKPPVNIWSQLSSSWSGGGGVKKNAIKLLMVRVRRGGFLKRILFTCVGFRRLR